MEKGFKNIKDVNYWESGPDRLGYERVYFTKKFLTIWEADLSRYFLDNAEVAKQQSLNNL